MSREEQIKKAAHDFSWGWCDDMAHPLNDGFIDGAKWADQHPAWVSVEERLPEKEKDNPSLSVNVNVTDGSSVFESYYNFNLHVWAGAHLYGTITHWMSLPTPPVKKGGEQ